LTDTRDEQYEMVRKLNRIESSVYEVSAKFDFLCKFPSIIDFERYVDELPACRILHVSKNTLYRLRRAGKIVFVHDKRHILYAKEEIFKYMEQYKVQKHAE
jgi:excisionase family DNA binding protein